MESGAKGCEVIVSGKLRGQRAKSMKFVDGFRIHAGHPTIDYIDSAVTHVHLRQGMIGGLHWIMCVHHLWVLNLQIYALLFFSGVLGIKVKIMLPHDPTGKSGPKKPLPDQVQRNSCQ